MVAGERRRSWYSHSGNVFSGEGVRGVRNKKTCLGGRSVWGRLVVGKEDGLTLPTAPSPVTTHCRVLACCLCADAAKSACAHLERLGCGGSHVVEAGCALCRACGLVYAAARVLLESRARGLGVWDGRSQRVCSRRPRTGSARRTGYWGFSSGRVEEDAICSEKGRFIAWPQARQGGSTELGRCSQRGPLGH